MTQGPPSPTGDAEKYLGAVCEVRSAFAVDSARLAHYLAHHSDLDCTGLKIQQFVGGQSNPTYLLTCASGSYVLRRRPPGALLPSAHAIDREYRALRALHAAGIKVPKTLLYVEDSAVIGSEFYVMQHVAGRIFFANAMPDLTPQERAAAYDSANASLAALHQLVPEEIGLGDFGRDGNYFERQVMRWTKQYAASKSDEIPEMDKVTSWLSAHIPPQQPPRVVHGDYSFHNLIYERDTPRVRAIIDWELATTGDPLADLLYHAMEWYRPAGVDPRGSLQELDLAVLGIPTLEQYIASYCARVGRPDPGDLTFYKVFNLFRVAAIIQGVVGRLQQNNAVDSRAQEQRARVRPLAQAAWREVQEARVDS
jgi:aminoglycoside phosphotransferase (APT) family kinase protein